MEPTPAQREAFANPVGGTGEYHIQASIDASNYKALTPGKTKNVLVENFAVKTTFNNFFFVFQLIAILRNHTGTFFVDVILRPANRVLVNLSATVKVCRYARTSI